MNRDYRQIEWDERVESAWREIVRLAIREDLARAYDWTTVLLVPDGAEGRASLVTRKAGVAAGLPAGRVALAEFDRAAEWTPLVEEGQAVQAGEPLARIAGSARSLLTAERTILNAVCRLSGIATLTRRFVAAVVGTKARIYDTRKTLPGWRLVDKYAVRMGGGHNHRMGLFDGVLIKDNHLVFGAVAAGAAHFSPAAAVRRVREFLTGLPADDPRRELIVEVEVDTLEQLDEVLAAGASNAHSASVLPDIVLLDNMPPDVLAEAVRRRGAVAPGVELEASGGVSLDTVAAIARSGVDRISAGALTHSSPWLDIGLDWE